MRPTVGRIVHYVAFGTPGGEYAAGAHRAAIVTAVTHHSGEAVQVGPQGQTSCDLCILNPTGLHFRTSVPYDETGTQVGSWHWPERE